jgi:hypothetical protein
MRSREIDGGRAAGTRKKDTREGRDSDRMSIERDCRDRARYHLPKLHGRKIYVPRRFRGMPPFVPTDAQKRLVEELAARGIGVYAIAQLVINPVTGKSIGQQTLRKHLRPELERGWAKVRLAIAETAYLMAVGLRKAIVAGTGQEILIPCKPDPRMVIYWERTRIFATQQPREAPARKVRAP